MKTYTAKPDDIKRDWYVVNAAGKTLGRLATEIARRLRGKHKPEYTPHMDTGDYIVVINAKDVRVSGNKRSDKIYHHHTGYPGGIKQRTAGDILEGNHPERVLTKAIQRMLPGGPLSRQQMTNLRVYAGAEHGHEAQNPEIVDVKSMNPKNSRSA